MRERERFLSSLRPRLSGATGEGGGGRGRRRGKGAPFYPPSPDVYRREERKEEEEEEAFGQRGKEEFAHIAQDE